MLLFTVYFEPLYECKFPSDIVFCLTLIVVLSLQELIPEFFYLPELFVNSNKYELGSTSDGHKVDDVILPPWAKSADDFVQMHRLVSVDGLIGALAKLFAEIFPECLQCHCKHDWQLHSLFKRKFAL